MNDFLGNGYFWIILGVTLYLLYLGGRPQWLARQRQQAEAGLFAALEVVTAKHLDTLAKKRRKLVSYDDYGVAHKDAWMKEASYFVDAVAFQDQAFRSAAERLMLIKNPVVATDELVASILIWIDDKAAGYALPKTGPASSASDWLVEHLSPIEFEEYCAEVLRENGWRAHATRARGDQGIDVIAWRKGVKAVLQCKKYESPVGNSAVQEIVAGRGYENAHVAAVVTNAEYTPAAVGLARANDVHLLHYSDLVNFSDRIGIANESTLPVILGA